MEPSAGSSEYFEYRLDDLPLARSMGARLPAVAADAIDIAAAIYLADRLAPRFDRGLSIAPFERWSRRLFLAIPVRDPYWWRHPAIRDGYELLLAFLTDDDWHLEFVRRSPRLNARPAELQRPIDLLRVDGPAVIVLHSGGLDSVLGLVEAIGWGDSAVVIPASVTTSSRAEDVQDGILAELIRVREIQSSPLRGVRLYTNLCNVPRSEQESTQRARGLLYLTLGAVTALNADQVRFHVAEHGTGAINLPYTPDQRGARTSKAVHPVTLARISDLFSLAFDRPMEVNNLLLWETKGESCQRLSERLVPVVQLTVSCDRFPRRDASNPCGSCPSCIVRAAALLAVGQDGVDRGSKRRFDFDPTSAGMEWEGRQILPLHSMRFQSGSIRAALAEPSPFSALLDAYPELHDVVDLHERWLQTPSEVGSRLVRLYGAYLRELDGYFATFAQPGWGPAAPIAALTQARLPAVG
ncbi:MAG: 7-cyano-7-deazaguanine synthase [Chloroflexia bacterium]|nr:7-cyano-7-deazaguanine synthase [Chloroflexia bacterium]